MQGWFEDINLFQKKIIKKLESYMKMDKKVIKCDDTEIQEHKSHQYEGPISINDIDINGMVVFNKFPFGKQDFKYFLVVKVIKKLDPYAYSF